LRPTAGNDAFLNWLLYWCSMVRSASPAGYTLIEVIVAIFVFGVGVLALAASSAIVTKATAANALRENSGRIAASRIELIRSRCRTAVSGEDRFPQISSRWLVGRAAPSGVSIDESVSYAASNGLHTDSYQALVWCP
jgi:prepilin-type N-terminal cleavage/methylation domain-containing protein